MAAARIPFFYRITEGIRVTARPSWLPEQSSPARGQYVFAYHIRVENTGSVGARLLSRRWLIHDDGAADTIVEGDGVVGEQPHLEPGQAHEYASFCVLKSPSGSMEGSYHFLRDDGTSFDAAIPRFELRAGSWPDAVM